MKTILLQLICIIYLSTNVSLSQAQSVLEAEHAAIAPYLKSDVRMVAWLDVEQIRLDELTKTFQNLTGDKVPEQAIQTARSWQQALRECEVRRVYFLSGVAAVLGNTSEIVAVLPCKNPSPCIEKLGAIDGTKGITFGQDANAVFATLGTAQRLDQMMVQASKPTESLVEAIKECQGHHGFACSIPREYVEVLLKMTPNEEQTRKAREFLTAIQTLRWFSLSQDHGDERIIGTAEFETPVNALEFANLVNQFVNETLESESASALLVAEGARVTISKQGQAELIPLIAAKAKEEAQQREEMQDLRQIGLAFHNFVAAKNTFPPQALTDATGKRLLSWRVLLLPYLGHKDLYDQFHLDEAWDSEHNQNLIQKMPVVFGDNTAQGKTRYLAVLTKNSALGQPGAPVSFSGVTDGTSITVWVVKSAPSQEVVWTKPEDLTVNETDPFVGLTADGENTFLAGFVDGSIRRLNSEISPVTIMALFSMNGGEQISFEDFEPQQ